MNQGYGGGDDDIFIGSDDSNGQDTLVGGTGSDQLQGQRGNDLLIGDEGNDFLDPGPGDDTAFGGTGDDNIHDGPGNDIISAGSGFDNILLSTGTNFVDLGPPDGQMDLLSFSENTGSFLIPSTSIRISAPAGPTWYGGSNPGSTGSAWCRSRVVS